LYRGGARFDILLGSRLPWKFHWFSLAPQITTRILT
jgi:hypothetical protein